MPDNPVSLRKAPGSLRSRDPDSLPLLPWQSFEEEAQAFQRWMISEPEIHQKANICLQSSISMLSKSEANGRQ